MNQRIRHDELGRLLGVNRWGESQIYPDYIDDAGGMRHPYAEEEKHEFNWSRDPRSEASQEGHLPDERIYEEVFDVLTHHPSLDAKEIEISVTEGVVSLSGFVKNQGEKTLAEDLVESLSGVKEIQNQLTFQKSFRD